MRQTEEISEFDFKLYEHMGGRGEWGEPQSRDHHFIAALPPCVLRGRRFVTSPGCVYRTCEMIRSSGLSHKKIS